MLRALEALADPVLEPLAPSAPLANALTAAVGINAIVINDAHETVVVAFFRCWGRSSIF